MGGRRQRRPPAGRARIDPRALVSAVAAPRDSGARAPGKFFQKCPCIGGGVPV